MSITWHYVTPNCWSAPILHAASSVLKVLEDQAVCMLYMKWISIELKRSPLPNPRREDTNRDVSMFGTSYSLSLFHVPLLS